MYAGIKSIVVPFLEWSDQPRFARWLESSGAAVHLIPGKRSEWNFSQAIRQVLGAGGTGARGGTRARHTL